MNVESCFYIFFFYFSFLFSYQCLVYIIIIEKKNEKKVLRKWWKSLRIDVGFNFIVINVDLTVFYTQLYVHSKFFLKVKWKKNTDIEKRSARKTRKNVKLMTVFLEALWKSVS